MLQLRDDGTLRERLLKDKGRQKQGIRQRERENGERHKKEGKIQRRTFGKTERLGIPGAALDARQDRTQVGRMSMESRLRR